MEDPTHTGPSRTPRQRGLGRGTEPGVAAARTPVPRPSAASRLPARRREGRTPERRRGTLARRAQELGLKKNLKIKK